MLIFTLAGNLGKDAETRNANNKSFISFSVAVNRKVKDETGNWKNDTIWVDCIYFPPGASTIADYLKKGQAICATGKGSMETFRDRNGIERTKLTCLCSEITLQGYAGAMPENASNAQPAEPVGAQQAAPNNNAPDNDLPF